MFKSDLNIAVLILAAGSATRMGGTIKQLLPWKDTTLLGNAINTAIAADFKNIFVVIGANKEAIREQHKNFAVQFIENQHWDEGLGTSLAFGVSFVSDGNKDINAILVLLADQPLISSGYLKSMRILFQQETEGIVATDYGNRVGVPALFSGAYFASLRKLDKDYGAKELLDQNKSDIFNLASDTNLTDIDTMEDYFNLIKNIK